MNEQLNRPEASQFKPKKSVALSGIAAGNTALCTVVVMAMTYITVGLIFMT